MILKTIREILVADASVNAIVAGRIYPDVLKEGTTLPAIFAYSVHEDAFDCIDTGFTGFYRARVRVETVAGTRDAAESLHSLVQSALNVGRGVYTSTEVHGVSQATGRTHLVDRPYDGSDRWRYRTVQSFDFSYSEI